jgi:hypothetical protein
VNITSDHRRGFLKLFGVGTAAVATLKGEEGFDKITSSEPVVPADTIPNNRFNSYYMDVQSACLYSSLVLGKSEPAHPSYDFFRYAVGEYVPQDGQVVQAQMSDTNMFMSGRLGPPEAFLVKRIGLVFSPSSDPELRSKFIDNYSISLELGQKTYQRVPLSLVFSVADVGPKNCVLPYKTYFDLKVPLVIDNQMSFRCVLLGNQNFNITGPLKMWAVLEGLHARGVQ